MRVHVPARCELVELGDIGVIDMVMPDLRRRSRVARADARSAHNANASHLFGLQRVEQLFGTRQHAAEAVADAYGYLRRARLVVGYDIEVGVERGHLVDFGHGDFEFFGQRMQVASGQAAFLVLDQVQVLDQQRARARSVAKNGPDSGNLVLPEYSPARKWRRLASAGAWMDGPAPASAIVPCGAVFHFSGAWQRMPGYDVELPTARYLRP